MAPSSMPCAMERTAEALAEDVSDTIQSSGRDVTIPPRAKARIVQKLEQSLTTACPDSTSAAEAART